MNSKPYTPPPLQPLQYLHHDDSLIVVVKPGGLLSVPGRGADKADCLISRIQTDFADALTVHRLDMETSGLVILARTTEAHRRLSTLFQNRIVSKRYIAVVEGLIAADAGTIELPLLTDWPNRPRQKVDFKAGKPSLTHFRVLERNIEKCTTRVELSPVTGRTHQLRVHLLSIGHPILGDGLYANVAGELSPGRLLLHASWLAFPHPENGAPLMFSNPAPF